MSAQLRTQPKPEKTPGIGPITATALITSVADARSFKNGRQLAGWGSPLCSTLAGEAELVWHKQARRDVPVHLADSRPKRGDSGGDSSCKIEPWLSNLLGTWKNPNTGAVA